MYFYWNKFRTKVTIASVSFAIFLIGIVYFINNGRGDVGLLLIIPCFISLFAIFVVGTNEEFEENWNQYVDAYWKEHKDKDEK